MFRKALCVGIDFYDHLQGLNGCVNDAVDVREALMVNGDGTPNFDVELLTSRYRCGVSRKSLRSSVIELFQGDCDICLFYFAGHGYADNVGGYLVTSDCSTGDAGLSFHDLLSIASRSNARNKVLILDCCNSGDAGSIGLFRNFAIIKKGIVVLAACRGDQPAQEVCGHGVFTELLLDALKGKTDLLGNVTIGSVYEYIDNALGPWEQRPIFKASVDSFVPLRRNIPPVPLENLRKLIDYFRSPEDRYPLNPTYEPKSGTARADNVEIFRILQSYNRAGLVRPVDAEHMYYAAMESKECELTPLGRCFWRLVERRRL